MDTIKNKNAKTAAERKAASRARQTEEEREAARNADQRRKEAKRMELTQEERDAAAERRRTREMEKTQEEREAARNADQRRKEAERMELTEEEREAARNAAQERMNIHRARQFNVTKNVATRTREILSGELHVPQLQDSPDTIGKMDNKCQNCGALYFKRETTSLCCLDGKIVLPHFPEPPPELRKLWFNEVPEAKVFLKYIRVINNAICLSSVRVQEKQTGAFNPSVIFQGRVVQRMGPLQPEPGDQPCFAQLYILDSSLETTTRFANMTIPANTTFEEKNTLRNLLETIQQVMHRTNPFINDFKQILEISEEDLQGGKVVISAAARPKDGHPRVYNVPESLKELSVVTNEKPHDLVLNLRGGGLQFISDLNPKAMPLHFSLLFPEGTLGYDMEMKQIDGVKRVSPRQFFSYHLNIRHTLSDYIFTAKRLFQEWILHGWIITESQRLNYQRQNQKNLRADTYKNIQEAVAERRQPTDSMYNNEQENAVGRKILASSFQCSPRWYNEKFQDAMAIVR